MNTTEIWTTFQNDLYGYILKRVTCAEDAQDILQSVFEKIHKNSSSLEKIENIAGWVYQITKNEIISYYRSRKDQEKLPLDLPQPEPDNKQDETEFYNKCMNVFINEVSSEERNILGSIATGKSVKQIAFELHKPYSTIKSKSLRTREKIRRKFIECCGAGSNHADGSGMNHDCNNC